MAKITEKFHIKRLTDNNMVIKTTYFNDGNTYIKTTDNSVNDSFDNGVRIKKEYYKNDNIIYMENEFDSRMNYAFINSRDDNKEFNCPNCGAFNKVKENSDGCPYCGTNYNLDYDTKKLGSKLTYDTIVKSTSYRVAVLIMDIICSFIIMFIYRTSVGRTFNQFDMLKIGLYTLVLAVVLYIFFYYIDAKIIFGPLKRRKERENELQREFWRKAESKNIDKNKFFNNFNYELGRFYYNGNDSSIIDYDILDYNSFKFVRDDVIEVNVEIRIMSLINDEIKEKTSNISYKLKRSSLELEKLNNGINMIKCYGCGSSIDVTSDKCDHCGRPHNYLQEWYMI